MNYFAALLFAVLAVFAYALGQEARAQFEAKPAKPETISCVRLKEVTPAGTINYLCEVRK